MRHEQLQSFIDPSSGHPLSLQNISVVGVDVAQGEFVDPSGKVVSEIRDLALIITPTTFRVRLRRSSLSN